MKNIGLMAHVDAGKTTITEKMLFLSGAIRQPGSVDEGTAQTDFMQVERSRGISVKAAVTQFQYKNTDINLIDTPGHSDFSGEVERALAVLDGAIMVVSAVEGVQAQTRVIWQALKRSGIPVLFFINKIDRVGADFYAVVQQIQRLLTENVCVVDTPASASDSLSVQKRDFREDIAVTGEELLERYIQGRLDEAEAEQQLASLTQRAELYPVLCGSAMFDVGIIELLEAVCRYLPDSSGINDAEPAGIVFKIEHSARLGKAAYIRLYQGTLKNRDSIQLHGKPEIQKISQIRKQLGSRLEDTGKLQAGDIAAVYGLSDAAVGDRFGSEAVLPKRPNWVNPLLRVRVWCQHAEQTPELIRALQILTEEEPLLGFSASQNTDQLLVSITGAIQTEILAELLHERFGLSVQFGEMRVIYRETPSHAGEGYDAYTMPKPCWAVLKFLVEPLARGSGIEYVCKVGPNKIPYRYLHHVQISVPRVLKQGIFGWEVTDIRVTLLDGQYHHEHTHPLDFFVATPLALFKALQDAEMVLLEPMLQFEIAAPQDCSSKIIGEIIAAQGSFESPVIMNDAFFITGEFPVATTLDFPVRLAAITGGKAALSLSFSGYRNCDPTVHAENSRRGVNPLDRSRFILWARNAYGQFGDSL